uniref:Capping protein regulator and myosin 1 linker 2 n=1 Tax=Bubo bubo TaxID=30461 RepID=A0A8C0F361_BUBBB
MSFDDLEQVVIHVTMSLKKGEPSPTLLSPRHPSPDSCPPQRSPPCSCGKVCHQVCFLFAGGFSETYAALCDYNGFAFREEIQWDVDNIYHSQDCREFNLLDFSHLESRDVALSVAALSFNLWFTKLSCKDFKLNQEISEQLLYMLSKSVTLEELVLENSGLGTAVLGAKLAPKGWLEGLQGYPGKGISKDAMSCCPSCRKVSLPLLHGSPWCRGTMGIHLSSSPQAGMSTLCKALADNKAIGSSLRHLDLSGNPGTLAGDDITPLITRPIPSPIHPQAVRGAAAPAGSSSTQLVSPPRQLFGALVHGCHTSLVHLDLSRNLVKTISPDIKEFFSQACALRHVSLAGTKLPADAVRVLLQGLADNSHISDLRLDLSNCELRSAGAQVIQDLIPDASSISDLDLSDNGFDPDMVTLVLSIGRSKSIRHVSLGKNFNIKSKEGLLDVLHRIVQLTQEDDCPLQSLSVAESRLKLGTNVLLSALGSNTSLITLDISGNAMGDTGAKMLAKALQINTKLRTVVWDRNNTSAHGLLEVAQALERNYTLKSMPLPMSDVVQAYRSNPEKTEEAVHKVGARGPGYQLLPSPHGGGVLGPAAAFSQLWLLGSCWQHRMLVGLSLRIRDTVLCPVMVQKTGVRDQLVNAMSEQIYLQDHLNLSAVLDQMVTDVFSKLKWVTCRSSFLLSSWCSPTGPDGDFGGSLPTRDGGCQHPSCTGTHLFLHSCGWHVFVRGGIFAPHRADGCACSQVQPVACENSEDRSITRVDEGLEDFFAKRLITEDPMAPETCPGSAPLVHSGSRTLKKKIGNFFAFKKPKSGRGSRCEKEPEGGPTAPRSRRSMLSDILRAPSKAGEAEPEHCQTPDSARRIRPKYSREGKSQSLILLSGEDEDALGVRHDKKRHLEKSEGELPGSFEQRVQVMLHRIGVTKGPAAESKKQQVGSGSTFGTDPAPKGRGEVVAYGMGVPRPGPAALSSAPPLLVASVLSPNPLQGG